MPAIALPQDYRFQLVNSTNGALTAYDLWTGPHLEGANGVVAYTATTFGQLESNVTVASGAVENSSAIDNATTPDIGLHGYVRFTTGTTVQGPVTLLMQVSWDGAVTWPPNGVGIVIAHFNCNAASTVHAENFSA